MQAVPRKKLHSCRYLCADHRGWLMFIALVIPVILLFMHWIDGSSLIKLPFQVTLIGVGGIAVLTFFILYSLRRAEYNYFEALAKAAETIEEPEKLAIELEENRGARLKTYILRDPEKLLLLGKIFSFSAQNRHIGKKMVEIAIATAPELEPCREWSLKETAVRYNSLRK